MEKRYLTLPELCGYTGLKPTQVYWLIFKRKIPFGHLTKSDKSPLIFDKFEIDKYIRERSITFNDIKKV